MTDQDSEVQSEESLPAFAVGQVASSELDQTEGDSASGKFVHHLLSWTCFLGETSYVGCHSLDLATKFVIL